jgi:hypothetical protein
MSNTESNTVPWIIQSIDFFNILQNPLSIADLQSLNLTIAIFNNRINSVDGNADALVTNCRVTNRSSKPANLVVLFDLQLAVKLI